MAVTFRCPCGKLIRTEGLMPDGLADCPACGRTIAVAERKRSSPFLWLALLGVGFFAALAFGLLVTLVWVLVPVQRKPVAMAPVETPVVEVALPERKIENPKPVVVASPRELESAPYPRPVAEKPIAPAPVFPAPPAVPVLQPPRVGVLQAAIVEPAGRYKVGETFEQDLLVTRRSAFRVLENDFASGAQYAFRSTLTVTEVLKDGSFKVEQTIRSAKLIDADADVKADLAAALDKAAGSKFELLVGPTGEVKSIQGLKDPIRVLGGNGVGQSMRLWSILDADGWKELAGLVFFQPEKPLKQGVSWTKPALHDWGPLGSWNGKTGYVGRGRVPGKPVTERVDYVHDIYYKPPAAGAKNGLPFQLGMADFRTVVAGGSILYDPATNRSTTAEETFRVRGAVQVAVAGINAVIEMEELQNFKLTMPDPAQRNLVGQPFPKK